MTDKNWNKIVEKDGKKYIKSESGKLYPLDDVVVIDGNLDMGDDSDDNKQEKHPSKTEEPCFESVFRLLRARAMIEGRG